jgi:hypothetical protein
MIMGGARKTFPALLCNEAVNTIVPGKEFDTNEYSFKGQDRCMKIMRRTNGIDEFVASYPRDITVEPGANYPIAFMNDLGPLANDGTREHAIYPVPDKAFEGGHRGKEATALMYEAATDDKIAPAIISEMAPCVSCDVAKIQSVSNQKTRVMPITELRTNVAADLVVAMPRSLSRYLHYLHIHEISTNYGKTFNIKKKTCALLVEY